MRGRTLFVEHQRDPVPPMVRLLGGHARNGITFRHIGSRLSGVPRRNIHHRRQPGHLRNGRDLSGRNLYIQPRLRLLRQDLQPVRSGDLYRLSRTDFVYFVDIVLRRRIRNHRRFGHVGQAMLRVRYGNL